MGSNSSIRIAAITALIKVKAAGSDESRKDERGNYFRSYLSQPGKEADR